MFANMAVEVECTRILKMIKKAKDEGVSDKNSKKLRAILKRNN